MCSRPPARMIRSRYRKSIHNSGLARTAGWIMLLHVGQGGQVQLGGTMRKLLEDIDKREVISFVVMLLYTSYFFTFNGILEFIKPNTVIVVLVLLIIVTGTFYLSSFRPAPLNRTLGIEIILCVLVILFNRNANFMRGNYGGDLGIITAFLFLYFSVHTDSWHKYFILFSCIWTMIHTSASLLEYLFPQIYPNYILPLFADNPNYDLLKIGSVKGYIPGLSEDISGNAMYLGVGLLILSILFLTGRKRKALFIPLVLTFLALLLSGKRAVLLFVPAGAAAAYLLYHSDQPKKAAVTTVFSVLIIFIGYIISIHFIPQLKLVIKRFVGLYLHGRFTNGRIDLYRMAVPMFLKQPLTGIGWDAFKYYHLEQIGKLKNVHNVYLQLLTENGIILSLPFFALLFSSYVRTVRAMITLRRDRKSVCDPDMDLGLALSIGMQTFFLLYCITGNPLYDPQMLYPYMCCLSIGEFYMEKLKQENAQPSGCEMETVAIREINP